MHWYLVITKPSSEELVSMQLNNAGFEVFNPKIKKYYPRLKKEKVIPLFSRYIFVKFDYVNDFKLITYTRGVSKILSFLNIPSEVKTELINELKTYCDNSNVVTPKYLQTEKINIGDKIKITSGVFEGIEGIVSGLYNAKERVDILLDLMKVTIPKDNVKKIDISNDNNFSKNS